MKTVLAVQRFALAAVPAVLRHIPSSGANGPVSADARRARQRPAIPRHRLPCVPTRLAPYLQPLLLLHLPPLLPHITCLHWKLREAENRAGALGGPARPRPVALTRMKRRGFASGSRLSPLELFWLVKLSPPRTKTPSNQSIHTFYSVCVCVFYPI